MGVVGSDVTVISIAIKYFCNIHFGRVRSTTLVNCFLYYNSRLLLCITLLFTDNDEPKNLANVKEMITVT